MPHNYDVIVLGCGGMGSAALAELAQRGVRVLGLEQFPLGHDLGSSHGETRIIRLAYYEHPDYVPLLRRAFERWYELEQDVGEQLLTETGMLSMGEPSSELITGIQHAAAEHSLQLEKYSPAEVCKRWPQWKLPESYVGVFENVAGYLRVERCVRAQLKVAETHGAQIIAEEPVVSWQADTNSVTVRTVRETYHAAKLVIAGGAWNPELLGSLNLPLTVARMVPCWFEVPDPRQFTRQRFPCFIHTSPAGEFYGFPQIDGQGLKLAPHHNTNEVSSSAEIDRTTSERDEEPLRSFASKWLTVQLGRCLKRSVCMYTLTPDRHFVIDRHPQHDNVVFAAGFSGHGFKFASVVGEILADLAINGTTTLPIKMFRASRFAKQ
jgi:sarcosine oxidase